MFSIFQKLFTDNSAGIEEYLKKGAMVVDVRTKEEFMSGHVKGSINIPLSILNTSLGKLRKYDHIIVCCRSGARSGQAKGILEASGIKNVINGGSWQNVDKYVNS